MIAFLLAIALLLIVAGAAVMGLVIVYHFRRLGMKDDPNIKKFLLIFEIGGAVIVAANVLLLFLIVI